MQNIPKDGLFPKGRGGRPPSPTFRDVIFKQFEKYAENEPRWPRKDFLYFLNKLCHLV